jgi:hypothetical protein
MKQHLIQYEKDDAAVHELRMESILSENKTLEKNKKISQKKQDKDVYLSRCLLDIFNRTERSAIDRRIIKNLEYNSDEGEAIPDVDHIIEIKSKKEQMLDISNIEVKLGSSSLRRTDKELENIFRKELDEHQRTNINLNFEGKYNSAESKREEDNKILLNIE